MISQELRQLKRQTKKIKKMELVLKTNLWRRVLQPYHCKDDGL